jgi:hypothetical protein
MTTQNIDMDEVLCHIKTEVLADELKERRKIVSGRNRKAAEKELRANEYRNKRSIDVSIDGDEVIDSMWDEDLLEECKSRKLIPDEDDDDDNQLYSTWDDLGDLSAYDLSRGLARLTGLPYTATKEQIINALAEKL